MSVRSNESVIWQWGRQVWNPGHQHVGTQRNDTT